MYLLASAVAVSYRHPADPRELLVYTQTAPDVLRVRAEIFERGGRAPAGTGGPRLEIDRTESGGWPWGWYLRRFPADYVDMAHESYVPRAELLLVAHRDRGQLLHRLGGYRGYRFKQRWWWVPRYTSGGVREWARWFLRRETFGPDGSSDQWLYVRRRPRPPVTPAAAAAPRRAPERPVRAAS